MTEERLVLAELLEKAGESDFLRAVAEAVLQLLMEADVEGLIGAGRYERCGQAAEMVAMQMRYEDGFDRIRLDAKASNGNHRRGAAVDQALGRSGGYVKARVEPAAAAEGVATTEELQSHWGHSAI